jgi:hypothetical protein
MNDATNEELRRIYDDDQADRVGNVLRDGVMERDAARRARVSEILATVGARTADDYFFAAMVFQHGQEVASYERAQELAMKALAVDPSHRRARWLVAAATDRALVARGQPQRYGTQFHVDLAGRWSMPPVDASVSDEERARWNVPPLAEALRKVRENNGGA